MIFANIKNAEKYYCLHPSFKDIFDFLRTLSKDNLPDDISCDDFKIIVKKDFVVTSDLKSDGTEKLFEAHREYIDIHYCICGSEGVGFNDISKVTAVTEYNEADDFIMLKGDMYKLVLHPGDFCIVFPEDAHAPLLKGTDEKVLKAIAKVKVQ